MHVLLQMPPVFLDSMKICMFESIKIGEESIKLMNGIKKVAKTSKFVKGWGIGLNILQVAMFYRSKKFCDCSVKMYLFGKKVAKTEY